MILISRQQTELHSSPNYISTAVVVVIPYSPNEKMLTKFLISIIIVYRQKIFVLDIKHFTIMLDFGHFKNIWQYVTMIENKVYETIS